MKAIIAQGHCQLNQICVPVRTPNILPMALSPLCSKQITDFGV